MPTYDYKCSSCENVQEEFHSVNSEPEIKCTECGTICKKIPSGGNFILKGSGWPSTDSKLKQDMLKKNERMGSKMTDRTNAGEAVTKISDLKR